MATVSLSTVTRNVLTSVGTQTIATNASLPITLFAGAPTVSKVSGVISVSNTADKYTSIVFTPISGSAAATGSTVYEMSYNAIQLKVSGSLLATYTFTTDTIDLGPIKFVRSGTTVVTAVLNEYISPVAQYFQLYNNSIGSGGSGVSVIFGISLNFITESST